MTMMLQTFADGKDCGERMFVCMLRTGLNSSGKLNQIISMPKDRRDRSVSCDRSRGTLFSSSSSIIRQSTPESPLGAEENLKEWEDARCPVCMEHPHNAVLLICSSYDKGCRPYMCNTSYRHSNCLDQFCKSFSETQPIAPQEEGRLSSVMPSSTEVMESIVTDVQEERAESSIIMHSSFCENQAKPKLVCPLCRGQVKDWKVVDAARHFMNEKSRSCSCETCTFSGTYADLRKHARLEHPLARPSEVDPERQRNWRRLERQRDLGDLLSTLQSSFGEDRVEDTMPSSEDGGWLTVFFLIRVFRPGSSSRGSGWSGNSRTRASMSSRRRSARLWGESYDGETGSSSREDDNESSDSGSVPWRRRVRRRTTPDNQS